MGGPGNTGKILPIIPTKQQSNPKMSNIISIGFFMEKYIIFECKTLKNSNFTTKKLVQKKIKCIFE